MIRAVGAMADASERAQQLVAALEVRLAKARNRAECLPKRTQMADSHTKNTRHIG
jgi:ABC-type Fe3+-hydroxamate transport system substrate-binding protein